MINMRLADITGFSHAKSLPKVFIFCARLADHVAVVAIAREGICCMAAAMVDVAIIVAHC